MYHTILQKILERCSTKNFIKIAGNCKISIKMKQIVRKASKELKKYVMNVRSQLDLIQGRILMVVMRISESLLLIP
jgi:hypothetical protein